MRSFHLLGLLVAGLCALALGLSDGASSPFEPSDFIRFVELGKGEGRLEVNLVTYEDTAGRRVDLVSAVHVADKGYFKDLERRFKKYDRVLYELVRAQGEDLSRLREAQSPLSAFQRTLTTTLGLAFQLDAIDYTAKNFVHADLDPETFFKLQEKKGESILSLLFKASLKGMEEGVSRPADSFNLLFAFVLGDRERRLKLIFARQLEKMEKVVSGFEEGVEGGSVLVVERNKVALEGVQKSLKDGNGRTAVFYGAAHMPDLETRLVEELHLKRIGEEWVTAWNLERKPASGEAGAGAPEPQGGLDVPPADAGPAGTPPAK